MMTMLFRPVALMGALATAVSLGGDIDQPWQRHTIDGSSRGADGTRLGDANGDGLADIVTGWEQGGITRVYLNPGPAMARSPWPAVTVGQADSVEDAVFVDLDGDGSLDVVSCCEGKRQVILVHWAPSAEHYLDPDRWTTEPLPASENRFRWMFSTPMDVDGDGKVDLLAGGKNNQAQLGWWKVPIDARDLDAWIWHPLRPMGWLMSLETVDMDDDGDHDILFTDRKGNRSGCFWLENPADPVVDPWREHAVGLAGREAMFLSRTDLDRDTMEDMLVATRPQTLSLFRRLSVDGSRWQASEIKIPDSFGNSKAPAAADLDGDGQIEIVFSTEQAIDGKFGVGRVVPEGDIFAGRYRFTSISGVDGIKHDLVQLIDLDADGDLDVLTCEERKNLGVIWYENPLN